MSTKRRKAGPPGLKKKFKARPRYPPGIVMTIPKTQFKKEMKIIDTARTFTTPVALQVGKNYSEVTSLNFVSAGTDRNQRIGREIHMQRLHFTATAVAAISSAPFQPVRFRCILFIDKESVQPLSVDILQEVYKADSATTVDFNLRRVMTDPSRFKVLYSQESPTLCPVISGTQNVAMPIAHTWDVNVPLTELVSYASGSNVPLKNNIYAVFLADNVVINQQHVFTYQSRVMFSD